MAEQDRKTPTEAPQGKTDPVHIGVRLETAQDSDRPLFANITAVQGVGGNVFLDFGFVEPQAFGALARMTQSGRKPPEAMRGKLVCRVAIGADVAAGLARQLNQLMRARPSQRSGN